MNVIWETQFALLLLTAFALVLALVQRGRAVQALRKSEERFQFAARATNDTIYEWDLITDTVWWSDNATTMLGYRADEIDPGIEWWSSRLYPDDLDRVMSSIQSALDSKQTSWAGKYSFRRADGSYMLLFDRACILYNDEKPVRFIGSVLDLTALKKAEDAVRGANVRLETIFDASPVAMLVMNPEGRIQRWSAGAERLFGWTEAEALGCVCPTVPPDGLEDFHRMIEQGMREGKMTGLVRYRQKRDGTLIFANISVAALHDASGTAEGVVAILEDITEQRNAETIRRLLIKQVITAQEEERRRVAHELHDETGQTLTALLRGLRQSEQIPTLEATRAHVGELRKLTLHVIEEIKRLVTGLRPSVLDDLGLEEALKRLAEDFTQHHGVEIDFQSNGLSERRLPDVVETALYRIVQETLTNIAKHARARNVSLLLRCVPSEVRMIVEDDGCGFDKERALRVDDASTHLGIYGMQKRAILLNGAFTIETTPGRGTTVYVQVPLEKVSQ
jgi:PAS domain S-box-containing protein